MTRLRKKLEEKDGVQFIHNVHGQGYKLVPPHRG
ncbi:MAG: helix-turn-helix domain-containing protein [Candidatus Obscuribacterales bacterium]|nr:helix-turn-helix domain-containing protein [Candidatus Obscuribacterales bacterium]